MSAAPPLAQRITPDDPLLTQLISAERVRMLFAPTPTMVMLSGSFAVGLAAVVGAQVGWFTAFAWATLCVLACAMRMLHWWAYTRAEDRGDPRWLKSLMVLCAIHGGAWGLAGVWLMPVQDLVTTAVIVATLVGGGAVCTFSLQAHIGPNLAMNVPMLMPAAGMLLTRMDGYGWFGAIGLTFMCLFMVLESHRAERRITELLWLRFTTDRISQERADALKLAQRNSAIKDQFLATMSHEMRTPLHGILGLAQLIHQRLPARAGVMSDARQHATMIQRSGEHLLSLINDVLDFSRIEAGQLHLDHSVFDLRLVLDEVLALSRATAASKQLDVLDAIELPHPCLVEGDAARVRQVLYNLLGNAIKFTDSGHVTLRVGRTAEQRIDFVIEDTGVGIPADQLERVFEAFAQLDGSFARRHQGTGLGLTISREIARAMGGDILCQSTSGQGSTFTMSVPLPAAPANAPTVTLARLHAPEDVDDITLASHTIGALTPTHLLDRAGAGLAGTALPAEPLSGHVLLVEDNTVNALVAQAAIEQLGLTITLVSDGQQALDLLSIPHAFDVVLMDCQMPVLDGIEATRRLRAHETDTGRPHVPVIALTANAMPQDRQRCTAAGMDDHLAKPFRQDELRGVLINYLHPTRALTA
jgi:signal transduction histidine kinase/ActR/RegA family two-component response regulator